MQKREKIEWLNYWIEDANIDKKRILLIGDSVTRELRKSLNLLINKDWVVDLIAMSFNILDDNVSLELQHYLDTQHYPYVYIAYNLGCHHGRHVRCSENEQERKEYEERTRNILTILERNCQKVITLAGTPERECNQDGDEITGHNYEIEARNTILKNISLEKHYLWIDLYHELNDRTIEYRDRIHFEENTYEFIANRMLESLFGYKSKMTTNRIASIMELKQKVGRAKNAHIYIYGNGNRGHSLSLFFQLSGFSIEGYIVSDEYYNNSPLTYRLEDVESNIKQNDDILLFVTIDDKNVWEKLLNRTMEFFTLNKNVYVYLNAISLYYNEFIEKNRDSDIRLD